MAEGLRARILEALVSAPVADAAADPEYVARPGHRHDKHRFHMFCALCQGEAETPADAVVTALADVLPDDLDAFVVEQAKRDPAFAAEYARRRVAGGEAAAVDA